MVPGKADQLPVAVRSPVASVEDEHQGTFGKLTVQVEGLSLLIWQYEGWEPFPNAYVRHTLLLPVPRGIIQTPTFSETLSRNP